jgi:hypothetical protein
MEYNGMCYSGVVLDSFSTDLADLLSSPWGDILMNRPKMSIVQNWEGRRLLMNRNLI